MVAHHHNNRQCGISCHVSGCLAFYGTVQSYRKHLYTRHSADLRRAPTVREGIQRNWLDTNIAQEPSGVYQLGFSESPPVPQSSSYDPAGADRARQHVDLPPQGHSSQAPIPLQYSDVLDLISEETKRMILNWKYKFRCPVTTTALMSEELKDFVIRLKGNFSALLHQHMLQENISEFTDIVNDASMIESSLKFSRFEELSVLRRMGLVEPIQINLPHGGVSHYVPILQTLRRYLEHEDVVDSIRRCHITPDECMGSFFLNHPFFASNPNALQIYLYIDEIEVCNPIGSKKGKHKIMAVYCLVGNVERKYLSALQSIHLVMLVNFTQVKKNGYEVVLEPFIKDMRLLHDEGINVKYCGNVINFKGALAVFCGDNLSVHMIGGLRACFNSGKCCRVCLSDFADFPKLSYESNNVCLRTVQSHAEHVVAVQANANLKSAFGVNGECNLTQLQYFNVINCCPPDVLHDIFEGFMVSSLDATIRGLVSTVGDLTYPKIKALISKFSYSNIDKEGAHPGLPLLYGSNPKIGIPGTGKEKKTLFRLFSFMVGPQVPKGNVHWKLYILASEICDIILSPKFDSSWPGLLAHLIKKHHEKWVRLGRPLTPKMHFMIHYPRLMVHFGPLRRFWCMRFEAFHQYFKAIARATRNTKNLTQTLSHRFQYKRTLEYAGPCALPPKIEFHGAQKMVEIKLLPAPLQGDLQKFFQCIGDVVCELQRATVDRVKFSVGSYYILEVIHEEVPLFFELHNIYSTHGEVASHGLLRYPQSWDNHLYAFRLQEAHSAADYACISTSQIQSHETLSAYRSGGNLYIRLLSRPCPGESP